MLGEEGKNDVKIIGGKDLQFSFIFETKNKILTEIHNLDDKKACQESDTPLKIIKDKIDISIIRYLMRLSLHN